MSAFTTDPECADSLDAEDPLGSFRSRFHIPVTGDGLEEIYLVGNSLGAPPVEAKRFVEEELDRWANAGVRGHFEGHSPWTSSHEGVSESLARLVGGEPREVVVMNSLTVNLHLLMVSFYRPTASRHKVLIEGHAFPSDHFAVESQIRQRGLDPTESMVCVEPRDGEETLRHEDLVAAIREHGDELALVLLPGVQYYTGQVLDMADLTRVGHEVGAFVGFDLAHAAGNVELALHEWDVDFAAWCTYKYLNSGPGGVAACFVNSRHVADKATPKLLGWWGANKETRFEMSTEFDAIPTVESWQLSCPPVLLMASLRASLEIFEEAGGMAPLRAKSELQVSYMDFLLDEMLSDRVISITPKAMKERGCQLALRVIGGSLGGRELFEQLEANGVACDWRYPDVTRVAPVPLYNTFRDIYRFVCLLDELTS